MALATEKPEGLLSPNDLSIDRFLCQVLRGEPAPWQELPGGIAAEEVTGRCEHHGVLALVFHAMHQRPEWASWPPELRLELEEASKAAVALELLRAHYLEKLMHNLLHAGIRFLLTKGEALARTHYPVPGTRTRCDSDVFIAISDIEMARQAVLDAGLTIVSPTYKTHQFTARTKASEAGWLEFDIHWRILNAARFARSVSFDEAWADSVNLPGMAGVRTLNAVHSLLLACMHLAGSEWHDQNRLIWIYDIHMLISAMTDDELMSFANHAVARNVQAACRLVLVKSNQRFGTDIPRDVMSKFELPEKSRRFASSNLGLLVDDWKNLPTSAARMSMVRELLYPSPAFLLGKFNKTNRIWLPVLYTHQIFSGIVKRLTLH